MSMVVATPEPEGLSESAQRILDVAEQLVAQRGFNGFSYADIAAALGVTKPSLHYHFPSKADLGAALIGRYTARFAAALDRLGRQPARERLTGYAGLYRAVLAEDRLCLCGMLAAEFTTLPEPMREHVRGFFALNEDWLQHALVDGRSEGTLRWQGDPVDTARMILDGLEGAMLVARAHDDLSRFDHGADRLLATITAD